jgi:glycosyltransferase involved in cell wall biosynthesis
MGEISLALVTYNQSALLQRFLENYFRDGADLMDLTIVDDGSDDATVGLLASLVSRPGIHIHRLPHESIARARNHALRNSPTPWLAFSDTDCILDRGYFETLLSLPSRYAGAAAVEGAVCPPSGPKPPFTHSMFNPKGGTFATANMAFHVRSVLGLGGFDEGFGNFREDTDLALTILDRLGHIPFCPELVVVHPHLPRSLPSALRKAFASQDRIVRAEIRLFRKHPSSYSKVRHSLDARGTLFGWCWKYSALYLKECLRYLFRTPGLTPSQRLRGIGPACAAMAVALWEQMCVGVLCMIQLGEITRLRSK